MKLRDTDKSKIEPGMVKVALNWAWRYRLKAGNREPVTRSQPANHEERAS